MYNLRADPFERGTESFEYDKWMADRAFLIVPRRPWSAQWLESFKEFPIRQKPASFNLDEVMIKMESDIRRQQVRRLVALARCGGHRGN